MKKTDLKAGYSIFGNKGNVWNNECHIAKGSEPTTMCGVPMLSSNWARIEDVQEIGCKECLRLYEAEQVVKVEKPINKYKVPVKITFYKDILVEANTAEEAEEVVHTMRYGHGFNLDSYPVDFKPSITFSETDDAGDGMHISEAELIKGSEPQPTTITYERAMKLRVVISHLLPEDRWSTAEVERTYLDIMSCHTTEQLIALLDDADPNFLYETVSANIN